MIIRNLFRSGFVHLVAACVLWGLVSAGQDTIIVSPGWNMVSVGRQLDGLSLDTLRAAYPSIAPTAWKWQNRHYRHADSLACYEGRWIFSSAESDIVIDPNTFSPYLIIDVSGGSDASDYPVSYLADMPVGGWPDEYKTTKIVLRRIPAGSFTMGSPTGELGRDSDETQHQVTLTKDFYIGVFEVTQKQWERVMGNWPSYFNNTTYRDARPVEQVSWNAIRGGTWPGSPAGSGQPAAGTFIQRLRDRTDLPLDLPTEAQWEYAARAGTTKALNAPWDDGGRNLTDRYECPNMAEVGRYWYNGGSEYTSDGTTAVGTAKVGSYLANVWGLYDMHGNVWEWCLDWYGTYPGTVTNPLGVSTGSNRVKRGGSWGSNALSGRSAHRTRSSPDGRWYRNGLRLCSASPALPN